MSTRWELRLISGGAIGEALPGLPTSGAPLFFDRMKKRKPIRPLSDPRVPFFLITAFIFLIYSNTFESPWILDDFNNIVLNPSVHLENLDDASLSRLIGNSLGEGRLDRPLARLTFGLNWFFGGKNPWGYHLLNIGIHAICAFFLFLTVRALHFTPRGASSRSDAAAVSLISALLWAANPVQTQAVTYIVQRMAALAGLFYVIGLYCFIQGRLSSTVRWRWGWWSAGIVGFLLGVASKENAVLLPLAVVLVELAFFQTARLKGPVRSRFAGLAVSAIVAIGLTGVFFFTRGDTFALFSYDARYFTMGERLLTQPRVLLFYLSQLFYPAPFRLSIEHEFALSTSVFQPWSTLPSILAVAFLIGMALKEYRSWPYLSFGILFFFLNHLIESSIIPLEIVFEHRNYIPSMFLFVPVARGLSALLDYCRRAQRPMAPLVAGFIVLLILCFGAGTYVRNMAWESPAALWTDAVRKAPSSGRALAYLAMIHSGVPGGGHIALGLYEAALSGNKTNKLLEPEIYNNIAALYYERGDYNQAARYWEKALEKRPYYDDARLRLSLAEFRAGRRDEALCHLGHLIARHPYHASSRNLRGMVYFENYDFENALGEFRQAMKPGPGFPAVLVNAAAVFILSGHYEKADAFLASVPADSEFALPAAFWKIKSAMMAGDAALVSNRLHRLLSSMPVTELRERIEAVQRSPDIRDKILLPPAYDRLLPAPEWPAPFESEGEKNRGEHPRHVRNVAREPASCRR